MPTASKVRECLSAFGDAKSCPANEDLRRTLGAAMSPWRLLVEHCEAHGLVSQWNYSGARFGWSLRIKQRDKIVLYLSPRAGQFLVGFVMSSKGVAAAQAASLPEGVLTAIANAPKYTEGTGFRLAVVSEAELQAIHALMAIKLATMSK